MNVDTSAVMRVVIKNFNMTASEMARVWAQQDKYIDLLESQLRQSEEKVRKKWSQREQMLTIEVIRKKQEVHEMKALVAELKASLARSPDELRQKLKKASLDHNYNKPVLSRKLDQRSRIGKSRKSGSPENSKFEIHPNSPEITEYSIHNSSTYEIYEDLH